MKSKIYLLWSLLLTLLLLTLGSCKSQESAYKAAYEAAKARDIQEGFFPEETTTTTTSATKPTYDSSTDKVQKETVTVVDGAGIKQFSVVVGSFINRTNAESLKTRMTNQGFNAFLAKNSREMFRVIVATYALKSDAAAERNRIKDKFYPEFQDAWILDNQ